MNGVVCMWHGVALNCMEWRGMLLHGMVGMMFHGMAPDCIAQVVWRSFVCHGVAWHGLAVLIVHTHCC